MATFITKNFSREPVMYADDKLKCVKNLVHLYVYVMRMLKQLLNNHRLKCMYPHYIDCQLTTFKKMLKELTNWSKEN